MIICCNRKLLMLVVICHFVNCDIYKSESKRPGISLYTKIEDVEFTERRSDGLNSTSSEEIENVNQDVPHSDLQMADDPVPEPFLLRDKAIADQLFEGCMYLDDKDREFLNSFHTPPKKVKKTHIAYSKLWNTNVIPYHILRTAKQVNFENLIKTSLKTISDKVCLKFRPKTDNDMNWITFYVGSGCWSEIGRKFWKKGATYLSLDFHCWKESIILHLLFHALGFFHENNREDRDDYVTINYQNIKPGRASFFKKHWFYNIEKYHSRYDFKSITHFYRGAYAKSKSSYTIEAIHNRGMTLGGEKPSDLDYEKLTKMFCSGIPDVGGFTWGEWSPCSRTCGIGYRFRKQACKNGDCKNAEKELRACRMKKCQLSSEDANFDDRMGKWDLSKVSSSCSWKLQASDPLKLLNDHTTGYGNFAMVDLTSGKCSQHEQTELTSSNMKKNFNFRCISFYYLMQGKGSNSLTLIMKFPDKSSSQIWKMSGDQGDQWKHDAITMPLTDSEYSLIFEYFVGSSKSAKMFLDDIFIDDGKCLKGSQECKDLHRMCKEWSESGECFKNPNWMLISCCKSCSDLGECSDADNVHCTNAVKESDSCDRTPKRIWKECCKTCDDCLDKNSDCQEWAQKGECQTNGIWMREFCKKSCKVCTLF